MSKRGIVGEDAGFSLIELLIVIIVLGILALIVVFSVGSARTDALKSTCITRQGSVEMSAESVKVSSSAYPVGTFTEGTPANPLVAGTVPNNGALLKEWPVSDDYRFEYVSADGSGYSINVYDASDDLVAGGCGGLV